MSAPSERKAILFYIDQEKEKAPVVAEAEKENVMIATQSLQPQSAIRAPSIAATVPDELRSLPGWLIWRYEHVEGEPKPRKVPYYTNGGRRHGVQGRPEDRQQLTTFDAAKSAAARRGFDGVGLALMPEFNIVALDFDKCIAQGGVHPEVEALVSGTYAEYSPSGEGVRAFMRGQLGNNKSPLKGNAYGFETFSTKGFVTVTGKVLAITKMLGKENTITDVTSELQALCSARFRAQSTAPDSETTAKQARGLTLEQIQMYLDVLPEDLPYEDNNGPSWLGVGMAIHHETAGEGFDLWDEWSQRSSKYSTREYGEMKWNSFGRSEGATVTVQSLVSWAEKLSPGIQAEVENWQGDFDDLTTSPLSAEEKAKQAAIRERNAQKAERAAQAAIEKAQALALPEILARIDASDLLGEPAGQLAADVIGELVKSRLGSVDEEAALKRLKEATGFPLKALRSDLAKARRRGPGDDHAEVSAEWPVPTARAFLRSRYTTDSELTLRHWQDEFLVWEGARYQAVSTADIRAQVYAMFERHRVDLPGRGPVDNAMDALKALANVPSTSTMPSWLCDVEPAPAAELVAVRNGLLHVPTRTLLAHDPRYFSAGSVDVTYSTQASAPTTWLKFLADAFPTDPESIEALQEWFGYLLTQDTTQQKALICVGPKRCGKGTIARVLRALLGEHNCTGPTLGQLSRQFGLQGLIGKSLAIISDARVSGSSDLQSISENILRITGEDAISVERKNMADWVGKLTTRFVLMTNILPGIVDAGGAVASRFIVLRFTQSFFGKEDPKLTDKLMAELPGILNWALDGLAKLQARRAFTQPATGTAAVEELIRKTTPILGFVSDVLTFDLDSWVDKETIYRCYRAWCEEEGLRFIGAKHSFFSELYANTDGRLAACEPRVKVGPGKSKQVKAVRGVRLVDGWAERMMGEGWTSSDPDAQGTPQ